MISREDAVCVLAELESNDLIADEIREKLSDIRNCIEAEGQGWHFWGASDIDYGDLHTSIRADLWTESERKKCEALDEYYTFTPAPYEVGDVIDRRKELEEDY